LFPRIGDPLFLFENETDEMNRQSRSEGILRYDDLNLMVQASGSKNMATIIAFDHQKIHQLVVSRPHLATLRNLNSINFYNIVRGSPSLFKATKHQVQGSLRSASIDHCGTQDSLANDCYYLD
jgi:hypothetical protein